MSTNNPFFGEGTEVIKTEPVDAEGFVEYEDSLALDIEDDTLVKTVDHLISQSRKFFKQRDLYKRRQKNQDYYLGQQIAIMEKEGKYKSYQARYSDNVIYESESTLKPMALSQVPELAVIPNGTDPAAIISARALTDWINTDMKKRETRWVLGRAYKHRPIYFVGCIKYRWDVERDDYVYESVHPNNVDVDYTSPDCNVDNMKWVAHHYELTAKEIIMRFPKKASEFTQKIKEEQGISQDSDITEKGMSSTYRISEVWFTWYKDEMVKDEDGKEEKKWQKMEGVLWKYKTLLLHKMKNPNWDWEGDKKLFVYDQNGKEMEITEGEVRESILNGTELSPITQKKVFRNYFLRPEKPFIFIGYDQLGLQPFDETSRIEQVLYLQDNINKRGAQITQMGDTAWGKNVFSSESGLTATDLEEIDMTDPDQDILVKGDIRVVHRHIPGQQPSSSLFQEQELSRGKAFSKMGAHSTTRGERDAKETATGRQILREGDISRQDDEVSETVLYAAERMARAALQMIKLRYTQEKSRTVMGEDGNVVFQTIQNDFVEDGMAVQAVASAVQKKRRKEDAFSMAQINLIDPLTFYEDIGATNAKMRALRLIQFTQAPNLYLQNQIFGQDMKELAKSISGGAVNPEVAQKVMSGIVTEAQSAAAPPGTPPPATPPPPTV